MFKKYIICKENIDKIYTFFTEKKIKSKKYKNLAKEYIKNINQDLDDIKINIKIIKNKYNMLLI